jgi:tRNA A37 threonylcarbamoyladenosine dehydratase
MDRFIRTEYLFGQDKMKRLTNAKVAIFGIGGVGGYVVEALARSGIGTLDLFDHDTIALSNINRQIIATQSTLGQYKVDVAKARVLDINPNAHVNAYRIFFLPDTSAQVNFTDYDYIVDAIDNVTGKIELAINASRYHIPMISSMGMGNKIDPTAIRVANLSDTEVCPLARVMRRELRKRGIYDVKVVYSKEYPMKRMESADTIDTDIESDTLRRIPGSNAFVPSVAGLIIAGEVVKELISLC